MRIYKLSSTGAKKILKGDRELYKADFEDSIKSATPGLWCIAQNEKKKFNYQIYINPLVENNRPCAYLLEDQRFVKDCPWEEYLKVKIDEAIEKREIFGYGSNARLIYGENDKLPGLIVDSYTNTVIIQINTAGIDLFREKIKSYFEQKFSDKVIVFLDNPKYRLGEGLPIYDINNIDENFVLKIEENELKYELDFNRAQKIGYYYDHRENRQKARELVLRFYKTRKDLVAADLFCYIGSWGLNLLRSHKISHVDFVDQGNLDKAVNDGLKLNGFEKQGTFKRESVFDFLKMSEKNYDIICSDPPAFCKSKKEKQRAIDGYLKLHKLCLKKINKGGLFLASSCTHYVNHEEFQKTVIDAAKQTGRNIQLVDVGVQGFDHPIKSINQKSSYLKYYGYIVE